MTMNIKYFSWIREGIGKGEESLDKPETINTVSDLLDHLCSLDGGYAEVLKERVFVRAAVNQVHVDHTHELADGDEVAFFPPVTGG